MDQRIALSPQLNFQLRLFFLIAVLGTEFVEILIN